jgi:gamma-D-glutamyl-L-lysine dipeptidyl-peptidase
MDYAICLISIVPVRAMPDDRSEQVTQLLFGEIVEVLDKNNKWVLVQLLSDRYQGWVSKGQLTWISQDNYNELQNQTQWVSTDLVQVLQNKTKNFSFLVSAGSSFFGCKENSFELLGDQYQFFGNMSAASEFNPETVVNSAMLFLQSPYQWGGKSALGIDCSGLTQLAFKMAGKSIHRDASQQATQGEMVHLINEAQPGDLLFFDNDEGSIIHTGIMIDGINIIHAHQKVRIDMVDHLGIFNMETKKYTHKLRVIKRIEV